LKKNHHQSFTEGEVMPAKHYLDFCVLIAVFLFGCSSHPQSQPQPGNSSQNGSQVIQKQIEEANARIKAIDDNYKVERARVDNYYNQKYQNERDTLSQKYEAEKSIRDELQKKPGVKIGMTRDQVRDNTSWGPPKTINQTTTSAGTTEQWVYENGSYLYFRSGKLFAIQN